MISGNLGGRNVLAGLAAAAYPLGGAPADYIEETFDVSLASVSGTLPAPVNNGNAYESTPISGGTASPEYAGTNLVAGSLTHPSGVTSGSTSEYTARVNLGFTEQEVYVEETSNNGIATVVGVRFSENTQDGYSAYVTATGAFIFRWDAGSATTVATAAAFTAATNRKITMIASGTTITVEIRNSGGTLLRSFQATGQTKHATNTRVGWGSRKASGSGNRSNGLGYALAEEYVP